jgi:hypothetical protein
VSILTTPWALAEDGSTTISCAVCPNIPVLLSAGGAGGAVSPEATGARWAGLSSLKDERGAETPGGAPGAKTSIEGGKWAYHCRSWAFLNGPCL